jgi:enoyl-CoA hydratase
MIRVTRQGAVGVVTLTRPEARNALTGQMMHALSSSVQELDHDENVRAIILTGADPAFCSGLDLKDLATTYRDIQLTSESGVAQRGLLPACATPIIGAINGPAVTGGLELALGCDWMIASREHASFADTHARVGVMPGAGMTIRLPQLIGVNRARQMSLTGNFINATVAYEWGLVNEVCDHQELLPRAFELARAIAEADPPAVRELRSMYEVLGSRTDDDAYAEESRWSRRWMKEHFDAERFATQRGNIMARGSSQQ